MECQRRESCSQRREGVIREKVVAGTESSKSGKCGKLLIRENVVLFINYKNSHGLCRGYFHVRPAVHVSTIEIITIVYFAVLQDFYCRKQLYFTE